MGRLGHTLQVENKGKILGRRMKASRKKTDYSQSSLAEKANLSVDTLRKIEGGHVAAPNAFVIFKLSQILGAKMEDWLR